MSGFLKKFSTDEYNKIEPIVDEELGEVEEIINAEVEAIEVEEIACVTPQEIVKQEVVKEEKKPLIKKNNNTFQTSNTRDEKLIRDDDKIRKRKINIIISLVVVLLLGVVGFFTYRQLNLVSIPSFALEKNLNDVEIWAAKNKIELDYTSEYSIKADEGEIISQSKKSGTAIQKGSSFKVVVSKGADQSEKIKLPSFDKMKLTQIEDWKEKNKASNVTIEKVFSEEVAKGDFISMDFKSEGIDASNYRRKDKLTITVSKGKEAFEKNIVVPDFKDKAKMEVETWAKEKEVKVEFVEQASKTIMAGNVISQDIEAKTKIAKNDTLKITVSKGKVSYVPNFYGLDETQASIEATKANVMTTVVKYYHDQVAAGQLISQSVGAGTEVSDENIVLIFSSGKPYVANFDGQDVFSLVQSIHEMNGLGAKLTYEIQEVASSEPKGVIVTASAKATFVNIGTRIIISISRGA